MLCHYFLPYLEMIQLNIKVDENLRLKMACLHTKPWRARSFIYSKRRSDAVITPKKFICKTPRPTKAVGMRFFHTTVANSLTRPFHTWYFPEFESFWGSPCNQALWNSAPYTNTHDHIWCDIARCVAQLSIFKPPVIHIICCPNDRSSRELICV